MSELHQSGLHPDADQLNAFVEHALPPHERQRTLAHLAGCPVCRAIVSLSLPPVAEAAHPHAEPVRRPWFLGWNLGWNLAWPVAVAFAALVPLVLYVHRTETSRSRAAAPSEIAESRPPAPPLAPPASSPMLADKAPSPHAGMEKSAGRPAATASPSGKRPEPVAPPPSPTAFAQIVPSAAAAGAAVPPPNPPAASPGGTARFSAGLGASGGSRPATAGSGNSGIYGGTGQTNLNENYIEGVPVASAPAPPPAAAATTGAAMQTVTVTDAPPMLETSDAALGGLALRVYAREAPLPSGLPALSTVSRGRLALALDTANTLFLSDDGGRRWQPVPAKWKGRAVSVKLATAPAGLARGTAQAAGAGLAGFAAPALAATPRQNSGVNSGVAGVVTDPTGAIISSATVAVTDAAGQAVRNTQTGPDGRYRIDGLAPGSYHLQARASGFQRLDLPVTLAASQQSVANLTLQVGAATETVTVTAAPPFETDDLARAQSQKKAALAGPLQPTPLFEITTESGERWISPDGQTWTRRP
jgi:hypothetical protein